MNQSLITGNLGGTRRDGSHPVKLFNSGEPNERCNFSIAVNEGRGDKQTTAWMDVTLFGPGATNVAEKTVPGQELHILGRLTCREQAKVQGNDGQAYDRPVWTIVANQFDGVTFGRVPRSREENGNTATPAAQPAAAAAASEEVPF